MCRAKATAPEKERAGELWQVPFPRADTRQQCRDQV